MKVVDPSAPESIADRPKFHNTLRKECPVAKVTNPNEYYFVTGYDNVKEVLDNHERFSKLYGSQYTPMEKGVALNQDPPEFNEFRAIYNAYMSPRGVKRWADDCNRIANDLIDKMEALGSGDIQDLYGKPVPARVTAIALGLPEEKVDLYRKWTDAFLNAMIRDPEEQLRIVDEMYAFFDIEFEKRRKQLKDAGIENPSREDVGRTVGDNLISVLMCTPYRGRYLTNDELRRTVRGFFVGGVDTTGALMMNTLFRLLEQPDLWEAVKGAPDLLEEAIDESLRFEPPALGMFRGATCPIEMGGETIPEGARVLFSTLSANRDPAYFEEPDTFKLGRKVGKSGIGHIAFGSGAHFCPGAWTARLEAKICLEVLIRRLPKLRITGDVKHFEAINFWVIREMPAAWD